VSIRIRGAEEAYVTAPCEVEIVEKPTDLFQSGYEFDERIPHTWLRITMTEGKFRQIRKMVTAINHRCQRLIRVAIEDLSLGDLQPGQIRELDEVTFFQQLKINHW
jgi:23S rRNA pseudouridine2457 synthase